MGKIPTLQTLTIYEATVEAKLGKEERDFPCHLLNLRHSSNTSRDLHRRYLSNKSYPWQPRAYLTLRHSDNQHFCLLLRLWWASICDANNARFRL